MNYAATHLLNETADNGRPAYNDQGQMTASGVINFLNNGVANIANKNRVARKTLVSDSLERLRKLQHETLKLEQETYKKLGVNDLNALQAKINEINKSGLINLSAEALSKMPLIKQAMPLTNPKKLTEAIHKKIRETLQAGNESLVKKWLDENVPLILGEDDYKRGSVSSKRVSLSFNDKVLKDGAKRAEILAAFDIEIDENGFMKGEQYGTIKVNDMTVQDDGTLKGWTLSVKNYPYFPWDQYDRNQQQVLLNVGGGDGKTVWEQFKDTISDCAPQYRTKIKGAMELMGVAAFAESATAASNIKGVLGELYTMTVLLILTGDKSYSIKYVGNNEFEPGKKIGVDVLFEGIGIQVKNYTPYRGGKGIAASHGINLSSKLKLGTFLERLEGISESDKEMIGLFYATTVYHLVATDLYKSIFARYAPMEDRIKDLYATQIDQFMPLHEISWMEEEAKENTNARNAFYLIGAGEVVPVSLILGIYIKFLEDLECGMDNPRTFTVGLSGDYGGQTYLNYWNAINSEPQQPYQFQGYDNIVGSLSVKLNINLNIDYTIEQVLSKVAKS